MTWSGQDVTAASRFVGQTVIDRQGLQGRYDWTLEWTPDEGQGGGLPDPNRPSIVTAGQEQLGLRLQPARGQVMVVFVEHVKRPTGN